MRKWRLKLLYFPLVFLLFILFIEITPRRAMEYVVYDDKSDTVYVVDRNAYKDMIKNPRFRVSELHPEDLRVVIYKKK
jgi:hypothetical protein